MKEQYLQHALKVVFKTDTKMMCRKSTSGLPQQTECQRAEGRRRNSWHIAGTHTETLP